MLTVIDWVYGTVQFAVVFLSIIAGFIALSMYKHTKDSAALKPWNPLLVSLVLFAVVEVLGGLAAFGVYRTPHLTHTITSLVLGFLLIALVRKFYLVRGWVE